MQTVSRETPLSARALQDLCNVSNETIERFRLYLDLLAHWQRKINLVGDATLLDPWRRHILDSAQLAPLIPAGAPRLIDLGSGAGFPGLVLALLTTAQVTLVDANARKCAFLREAARVTGAAVTICPARIESLTCADHDVVTARALAPLSALLPLARQVLAPTGICLLLKGRDHAAELTRARQTWTMHATVLPSRSDPAGAVLRIEELAQRHDR